MIAIKSIAKSFGSEAVLEDVSFSIQPGERVSITGPGGCGKTSLLKIILGLLPPNKGTAEILGVNLHTVTSQEQADVLRKVGMAFQQGGLFDFMTIKENLLFAMKNMTLKSEEEMEEEVQKKLAAVKLARTEHMYPHELSGGMVRRVGIARALCTAPTIAIFDEPTSGLDPVTSTIILKMIFDLGNIEKSNNTLLIATSNIEIAIRFAPRVIILNKGRVVADGPWRDLLMNGDEWVRKFLSVRLIGLDFDYAKGLDLPQKFLDEHW